MSKFKQSSFLKIIFFLLLFFAFSQTSFASNKIYFTGPSSDIAPGGEFVISVILDAGESINALDLELNYGNENLEFLDFNNTGSIIDFWQSKPQVIGEGKIKLSGGIMTPFKGNSGLIIKIYFKALSAGEGKINFTVKNLYLADGKGTLSTPETTSFSISIKEDAPKTSLEAEQEEFKKDETPPDIVLTLVKNPKEDLSLIVFNAKDLESGIKETQIRFKKWFSFTPWISAQNPVLYPPGVWVVELKATNNAELENIETLKMPWKIWKKFLIILLPLIFLVFLSVSLYNKYKRIV